MKPVAAIVLVAGLAIAACSSESPTTAPSAPLLKRTHTVSWTLGGTLASTGASCAGGYVNALTSGSNYELSHLGRTSGGGDVCVVWTSLTGGEIASTNTTLVAANGDEVHIALSGSFSINAGLPITLAHSGTYTITGGTGRFTGAEGSGTYSGTHYAADNSFELVMAGTLKY